MSAHQSEIMKKTHKHRVSWRCFACGRTFKKRMSLYGHLKSCYWYNEFKDRIDESPFFRKRMSRQLKYYYRKKRNSGDVPTIRRQTIRRRRTPSPGMPKTLKRFRGS